MTNWFTAHLIHHTLGRASQIHPDTWQKNTLHFWLSNNLDSGAFRGAQAQWDKITVPMYTVGNWSGKAEVVRVDRNSIAPAGTETYAVLIQQGHSGPIVGAAWLDGAGS